MRGLMLVCRTALLFSMVSGIAGAGRAARNRDNPGYLSVKDFGAHGNWNYADRTGADDTASIQKAIDHAASENLSSKVVYFPPGSYRISSTIRLPNWVRLRGDNCRNSQIHADPSFRDPWMFHAANGKTSMFSSRLEELWLRVHNNTSIQAVIKADAWQENDGLRSVVITEFTRYALQIEYGYGGAATLHLEDCELFAGSEAREDSAGIYVHQISQVAAFLLRVDSTVITGASAEKPLGYGVFMANDTLVARALHFEYTREGVHLENKANAILDAVTGSFTKTDPSCLIALGSNWEGFLSGRGLMPNGFDSAIREDRSGRQWRGNLAEVLLPESASRRERQE